MNFFNPDTYYDHIVSIYLTMRVYPVATFINTD